MSPLYIAGSPPGSIHSNNKSEYLSVHFIQILLVSFLKDMRTENEDRDECMCNIQTLTLFNIKHLRQLIADFEMK